jgi:leucyl aminopeptidase
MSNGPARSKNVEQLLQKSGDLMGDPYEISTIRREDYKIVAGRNEYEDLLQCTNNPSSAEPRGHQFPAAFLIRASGLDKHSIDSSEKQLPYSHVDIAGSSGKT